MIRLFDLRSSNMVQMKGIDPMKKEKLFSNFSFVLVGDIWRKPLIKMTKSAKISCKAFSYGAIPDLLIGPTCSKMEQMNGINALQK